MVEIHPEIGGALIGAAGGALIGVVLSRWTVRYDRRLAACAAMQALVAEALFNAHVVQHLSGSPLGSASSALERQAFDEALPVLHILPPNLGDRCRERRSDILILMHIDEVIEDSLGKPNSVPNEMLKKRAALIADLPAALTALASEVEAFVATDCVSWWRSWRRSLRS